MTRRLTFSLTDVRNRLGEVRAAAKEAGWVSITDRGVRTHVLVSREEFDDLLFTRQGYYALIEQRRTNATRHERVVGRVAKETVARAAKASRGEGGRHRARH